MSPKKWHEYTPDEWAAMSPEERGVRLEFVPRYRREEVVLLAHRSPKVRAFWANYEAEHPNWRSKQVERNSRYWEGSEHWRDEDFWESLQLPSVTVAVIWEFAANLPEDENPVDQYLFVRAAYVRTLEDNDQGGHDIREALICRDDALISNLRKASGSNWDVILVLRSETEYFRQLLTVAPAEEPSFSYAHPPPPPKTRGPGGQKSRPRSPALPRVPDVQDRGDRNAKTDARVLRFLARVPAGLSRNKIQTRLKMGRAQVTRALQRLVRAQKVTETGTGNDSRYMRAIEVVRQRGRKSPPKE